jgi:hypothetical protein
MSGGNQKKADKAQKSAVGALQQKSYSDPYGSFSNGAYSPNLNAGQQSIMGNADNITANALQQIPQHFDVNSYYNNPFYQSTYDQITAPIHQQQAWDTNELHSDLNAKGQMGSSYDALMHQMLNQNYNNQYVQAAGQARAEAANAYQQAYQNAVNTANTASALKGQTMAQVYQPFNNALAYQQAVTPLQQGISQVYSNAQNQYLNRPTFGQNMFNALVNPFASGIGQGVGYSLMGGGRSQNGQNAAQNMSGAQGGTGGSTSGPKANSASNKLIGASSGAFQGAQMGAPFGPWGMAAGAALGGARGYFS